MFPDSIQESGAGGGLDLAFSSSVRNSFAALEAPVQCGARRGRVRRTRRPQAGRNQHFRSCVLTGAIAVMCYSSQPTDKCAQVRGRRETASKRD